jgi:ABC-type multidrug transport system ATPase subunit
LVLLLHLIILVFQLERGKLLGFLSHNGAGKIAARQSMSIMSENSNVNDDLTAWQNMMFSAEHYHVGKKEREKKANELLRKTLAMRLVNSPHLLFLDEPTSGLDVQSNLFIRDVVSDLVHKSGKIINRDKARVYTHKT